MTSQGLSNYKHKQQLKHPRRYAPIRPVQKGRFTRNTWPQSLGKPGPNPSELPGAFLRITRADSLEYAADGSAWDIGVAGVGADCLLGMTLGGDENSLEQVAVLIER